MGGSTTTQQSGTSESTNQIPQWVQNAGQQNYGLAQQVASQPLQQYWGQLIADIGPQMQQAWNLAANSGNVGQDAQSGAQAGYLNTLGQTPQNVQAGQLSNTNLQPYMNPYTQDVINKTLPIMQQNLGLQQDQQQNAASSANAFGGSRQGVQQGVTQAQGALGMGQMAAGLNQANFTQAQGAAQNDIANQLKAAQGNQQAGLSQEALVNQASAGLGVLGNQQMQNNLANFGMLNAAGGMQQQQAQNQINAQIAKQQQAFTYPQQQLGMMESALGMTPYDTATSGSSQSTSQQTQSNPMQGAMSAMNMLGSLFPGGQMAGLGSALGNVINPSDRRLKTDIVKLGKHPTGLSMYAYRYKGDPKHYPKVVGPMAEDVKKIAPHAVHPIDAKGHLGVDAPTLSALSGPRRYAAGTANVQPPGYSEGEGQPPQGFLSDASNMARPPSPPSMVVPQGVGPTVYDRPKTREEYYQAILPPSIPPNVKNYMYNTPTMALRRGISRIPGSGHGDTVHAMLTPGEAVLTAPAANHLGRRNIARLNALGAGALPPSSPGVAKAIGMLGPSAAPGRLSPNATPPSRGILGALGKRRKPALTGALGA